MELTLELLGWRGFDSDMQPVVLTPEPGSVVLLALGLAGLLLRVDRTKRALLRHHSRLVVEVWPFQCGRPKLDAFASNSFR
jgi:hypothetical protein